MGLFEIFASILSQILIMDPMPDVNRAYYLLLQEEQQRELHVTPSTQDIITLITNAPCP